MTLFMGKRSDNKNMPNRSYAQAASGNRFEALSDPEDDHNEEMVDTFSSDTNETTPKQGNAKAKISSESNKMSNCANPLSKKSQRKLAKVSRQESNLKINNNLNLSSATKATLERARRAKESLVTNSNIDEEVTLEATNGNPDEEVQNTSDKNSKNNTSGTVKEPSSNSMDTSPKNSMPSDDPRMANSYNGQHKDKMAAHSNNPYNRP
jgi:hypothetical protein